MHRLLMIGLGDIAQKAWLPVVANHPQVELYLWARDAAKTAALATQYRLTSLSSWQQAKDLGIQAVLIHAATEAHFDLAYAALSQGYSVLIDKPIAYHQHQVQQLADLAAAQQQLLMPAFNRRYSPLVLKAQQQGSATSIILQKYRQLLPGPVRQFVFDDFIHLLDTANFLADGELAKPKAPLARWQQDRLIGLSLDLSSQQRILLSMDRDHGCTGELYQLDYSGVSWQIDQLMVAKCWSAGQLQIWQPDPWQSNLQLRGFTALFDDFLTALGRKQFGLEPSYLLTHALAELLVETLDA